MKRVHLYTMPVDTALPADTSALPDGYPYLINGVLHYLVKGPLGDGTDDAWQRNVLNRVAAGTSQTVSDRASVVGCTAAGITITLASAMVANGSWIDVVDESGGAAASPITIATEGTETIDGATTLTIDADYGQVRLYSDGTNWFTRSVGNAAQVGAVAAADVENGSSLLSGDGALTTFTIAHSLGVVPSVVFVQATSPDARAAAPIEVANKTTTGFDVVFTAAPVTGTDNVGLDHQSWV